jgi:Zn-dependent metalloprotease
VRLDRQYRGLRVIGGDMVVHSTVMGVLLDISRASDRLVAVDTQPVIAEARAVAAALSPRPGFTSLTRPQRVVYARDQAPELAYDVLLAGTQADGTPSELHVIVSAVNGAVLDSWDDVHTAEAAGTGNGFFNGSVTLKTNSVSGGYELKDPSRGNQYTINLNGGSTGGAIFTSTTNSWGDGKLTNAQTTGVDAQYGTAVTWDYFKNVHSRTGITGNGTGAYNRVHYKFKYNNAFWSDSCFCMTYGDGDGRTFNPFDSLDVAGHEMSHGVTSRTANLTYSGESGGLNEATSDIFGTMVEYYANNAKDAGDYFIGEKLYKSGTSALRTLINPSQDGVSADCWYSTLGSLDVHYSSGVANHFYYLLAEGTAAGSPSKTCVVGNTKTASGTGTLSGIGRAAAEKIWYRALTVYMTSSTNYAAARIATLKAATDLYTAGSAQYNAVANAWSAVLVN